MKVLKFGGTSVGNADNIRNVVNIIRENGKKIVVFSAMSRTTDLLLSAVKNLKIGNEEKTMSIFKEISRNYIKTAYNLIQTKKILNEYLSFLEKTLCLHENIFKKLHTKNGENTIISIGEILTVELIKNYLLELNIKATILPALEIIKLNEQDSPDYDLIEKNINLFLKNTKDDNLYLIQGFICKNHHGEIDNLKRGGSDFTATIIGSVCMAEEIQIWSDIDGLHNNDPRYVSFTKSVQQLSYEEAEELAYFGAKVLHPTCIYPAKLKKIPILLKNTMNPSAKGTIIYDFPKDNGIKAIAAKDGIVAIKIHSGRMLQAFGFLKKIFEIFEFYKTPVDMITTSEVSVSITIDNPRALQEVIKELRKLGTVDVFNEQSIICVVGNFKSEEKGIVVEVLKCIKHVPIRMVSYGASENNLSLLVQDVHKKEVLRSLQISFFPQNEMYSIGC